MRLIESCIQQAGSFDASSFRSLVMCCPLPLPDACLPMVLDVCDTYVLVMSGTCKMRQYRYPLGPVRAGTAD